MTKTAPITHIQWPRYHRLINSAYPPIDLFEDIADPQDWALLARAESHSNARLSETIGALDNVPPQRRVGGTGATYVMAPFTHISPDRRGRFHDGTFGAFYAADTFETALFETLYHTAKFPATTAEPPGWIADMRELTGTITADLVDIRGGFGALHDPDDYSAAQHFARDAKTAGHNGILYNSVRDEGGTCFAAFYPDVMSVPVQGRHLSYHWNGARIDLVKDLGSGQVFEVVP
ncbi:MAG: RES family NAD+ phosphorylase [Rhodobacterales bacterium]|nr:RES family NAD+ phosphorylase [Rhodobacterales bacterium]